MREIIAISGSNGFIGSNLWERFKLGQIERLDRTGYIPVGVNMVIDLASYGNMSDQKDIEKTYQANLMRVIDQMDYLGERKYLYISTSSVMLPVQTPYSLSKRATEEYLKYVGKNIAIVRPFTVIGRGEQEAHLIPKLIDSCLNGTEMPFVSEPVHDFIDVEDFVDALLAIKEKGKFRGEIYNVGSGKMWSNEEIKDIVEELTGRQANLKYVESLRNYDTERWVSDNKAIYALGWRPRKGIKQTIAEMIYDYERKNT